jgi:hypothetical protein
MIDIIKKHIQLIIIAFLICIIFIQRSCTKSNTVVNLPSITDVFEKVIPIPIKYDTVYKDSVVYKDKVVKITNPVNVELAESYLKAKDSITRLNLYIAAIEIKRYKEVFDDSNVTITVDAETTGKLNWVKPSYVIKERKVILPVRVKQTVFAAYLGGGFGISKDITPSFTGNVGFQNKRGDIILGGYAVDGTVSATYIVRILNIKK